MGFAWTSLVGDDDRLKAAHIQEVIDNIKTVEEHLEMTPGEKWAWTSGMDPFIQTLLKDDAEGGFGELKEAADNLDDLNECRVYYVDYDGAINNPHHYAFLSNDHCGEDNPYHSTFWNGKDVGMDGSYFSGHDVNDDTSANGSNDGSVDTVADDGYDSGDDVSAKYDNI